MIEDALFLALGFCTAVVLALALLPLLWARALRLTRQRLELLVPWSKSEIDAERDGLRAQAAIEQRRLEQDLERARATQAARDVALGQRTVDLVKGETERDALRLERSELQRALEDHRRAAFDAEGQRFAAEKALHDADRFLESALAEAHAQALRHDALSNLADERRGAIAALETRVAGLMAKIEDRDDALLRISADMAETKAAHAGLATRHHSLEAAQAALRLDHEGTQQELAEERHKAAEREARLRGRTEALTAAETRITEQDASMKQKDARLETLQRRFDALTAELLSRAGAAENDAARDARLRSAIVAAGDDALHVLAPQPDRPSIADDATDLVKEQS